MEPQKYRNITVNYMVEKELAMNIYKLKKASPITKHFSIKAKTGNQTAINFCSSCGMEVVPHGMYLNGDADDMEEDYRRPMAFVEYHFEKGGYAGPETYHPDSGGYASSA